MKDTYEKKFLKNGENVKNKKLNRKSQRIKEKFNWYKKRKRTKKRN